MIALTSLSAVPTLPAEAISLSAVNCSADGMIIFIPLAAIFKPLSSVSAAISINAYQYHADFVISSLDGPLDIENAIVDKLGKNDIKWEYLGEMMDPKVQRITYEEVIDGTRPVQPKKVLGAEVATGV